MGIKEKVERNLMSDDLKILWNKIYERFEQEGKEGVKKVLEEEANNVKREFEDIKRNIERQIGG